ncbi:hypothetical protein WKV53_14505 [Luteolibacter sp. Y139]|uniref:Uncharacterized protein n=1 Tax=Luteolibacter soli TaxID=3135280 RepID=A0ABU9AVL4_9BACT
MFLFAGAMVVFAVVRWCLGYVAVQGFSGFGMGVGFGYGQTGWLRMGEKVAGGGAMMMALVFMWAATRVSWMEAGSYRLLVAAVVLMLFTMTLVMYG